MVGWGLQEDPSVDRRVFLENEHITFFKVDLTKGELNPSGGSTHYPWERMLPRGRDAAKGKGFCTCFPD